MWDRKYKKQYYHKNKSNSLYKLRTNVRGRLKSFMKQKSWSGKSLTQKHLGCDYEYLKKHLESLWSFGMTWDNYGKTGWHIDHIIPLCSANNETEILHLCHYTNLQPLWAKDNLKKGKNYR